MRSRWLPCLTTAFSVLLYAHSADARPYDCPNTKSNKRRDYVCEMNSRVAPDFWNAWGEVKKNAVLPFSRYIEANNKCSAKCESVFSECNAGCSDKCDGKPMTCGKKCDNRCERQDKICEKKCSIDDFKSGFRKEATTLVSLANDLVDECLRSAGGAACEQEEAKPFCTPLIPQLVAYKQAIQQSPRNLRTIADTFKSAFLAIGEAINKRHGALSDEIKNKAFKCPKQFATNAPAANQVSCIDPQYNFVSSAMHARRNVRLDPQMSRAAPGPWVGCTESYCWSGTTCDSSSPTLVQNFGPAQIKNYFGVAIGESDNWRVGDSVFIEDEEFPIVCIARGAPTGGDTNCGNTKASFDIVVVDPAYRPSTTFPTGSCVAN